ncbi:MAG: hypothetical protein JNK56_06095 [Myxococcales bacterium]|nr:hypothetical protein [Myxococcales bacterium]
MLALQVEILRFVDDTQPGWVECQLVDVSGETHVFVEKVPVVSDAALDASSRYPQPGLIACTLVERRVGADGGVVLLVDTTRPWGVASLAGGERFAVRADQTVELARLDG